MELTDVELIAALWRRRVEYLWMFLEDKPSLELDIEWLDQEIMAQEARDEANNAPKG